MSAFTIATVDGTYSVPELWHRHHWSRPFAFLSAVRSADRPPSTHPFLFDKIVSGFRLRPALQRRSLTGLSNQLPTLAALQEILRAVYRTTTYNAHIFASVLTVGVEDWQDGFWLVDHSPRTLRAAPNPFDAAALTTIIQGQVWGSGPGVTVLLGIDWSVAADVYEDSNTAYADALLAVGRMGHSILLDAQPLGLAGRMTPAVHESTAAAALGLPADRDILYVLRLAYPAE